MLHFHWNKRLTWKQVGYTTGTFGKLALRRRLSVAGLPAFSEYVFLEVTSNHSFPLFKHCSIRGFCSQGMSDAAVRALFEGYDIHSITKLFAPREEKSQEDGNHHYCFFELNDEEQTDAALT